MCLKIFLNFYETVLEVSFVSFSDVDVYPEEGEGDVEVKPLISTLKVPNTTINTTMIKAATATKNQVAIYK